jgi:uncharacterized protein YukE
MLGFVLNLAAQAQSATTSSSTAAQSAPKQANISEQAATQNAGGMSAANSPPTNATTQPSAKKVWTNDDMGTIHKQPAISTFSASNAKAASVKKTAKTPGAKNGKQYREQILKLQAKLPPLDEQISQLQAGLNGQTVNSTRRYGGLRIDDWHDQLVRLQKQRDDIANTINSLQDEARHNGVPDNQIP